MQISELNRLFKEIKGKLKDAYGLRLKKVVLYGSYARKENAAGSDLDLLLILNNFSDIGQEIQRLSILSSDLSLKYEVTISIIPVREKDYIAKKTSLLRNASREGIAI